MDKPTSFSLFLSGQSQADVLILRGGDQQKRLFMTFLELERDIPFYLIGEHRLVLPLVPCSEYIEGMEGTFADPAHWSAKAVEGVSQWISKNPTSQKCSSLEKFLSSSIISDLPFYCNEIVEALKLHGMITDSENVQVLVTFYDRVSGASVWHQDGLHERFIALMYVPDDSHSPLVPTDLRVLGDEKKSEIPDIHYGDVLIVDNHSLQHKGPDSSQWAHAGLMWERNAHTRISIECAKIHGARSGLRCTIYPGVGFPNFGGNIQFQYQAMDIPWHRNAAKSVWKL